MKFKKLVFYLFVLFGLFGCSSLSYAADCWITPFTWLNGEQKLIVHSYYSNGADALAAATAFGNANGFVRSSTQTWSTYLKTRNYPGDCLTGWLLIVVNCPNIHCKVGGYYEHYLFFWPDGGSLPGSGCGPVDADGDGEADNPLCIDTDNDGIPDILDPYPESAEPFNFRKLVTYLNEAGEPVGYGIRLDDGSFHLLGTQGFMNTVNSDIDPFEAYDYRINYADGGVDYPSNQNDYLALITGIDGPSNIAQTGGTVNNIDFGPGGQISTTEISGASGSQSTGSETDNEALQAIQTNTAKITENQNSQAQQLERIARSNEELLQSFALAGGYGGPSSAAIGTAVGAAVADAIGEAGLGEGTDLTGVETRLDTLHNDLTTTGEFTDSPENIERTEGDASGLVDDYWSSFNNLPVTGFLSGSDVSNSGIVSTMSITNPFTDEIHVVDFSTWESYFDMVGYMLLSITSLLMGVYVFRG